MISETQARQIAAQALPADCVIVDGLTVRKPYGWVFFWQSRKYLEAGDTLERLVGNCPMLVLRESGALHHLPTFLSVEMALARFEQGLPWVDSNADGPLLN